MSGGIDLTLSALADGIRRAAVEALAEGPMTPGELAARLEVTPAALTRHLRSLRQAGLVSVAFDPADARRHLYTIRPEPLRELTGWGERLSRFWGEQLASYGRAAEVDRG